MSFLDRIPGLRRLSQSAPTEHVMSTAGLVKGLVRTGKWVFYFPTKEVGILADIRNFPEIVVMLTKPDGTDLRPVTCRLDDLRLARHGEIPEPRRPSADVAAQLGYHA